MTLGTSPHPLGAALDESAGAEPCWRDTAWKRWLEAKASVATVTRFAVVHRIVIVRSLAGLYLVALAVLVTWSWGLGGELLPEGQMHMGFLVLAGAGVALASLGADRPSRRRQAPEAGPLQPDLSGLNDLLAQMSHELRTPLNAVIGYSEVMRHELHGPLNERYQEYVVHISESGGRMLKSSLDAIAVAEAVTSLLNKLPAPRRESVPVAALVREALRALGDVVRLEVACSGHDVVCEERAAAQALEHLLKEAAQRSDGNGILHVTGRRVDSGCSLLISLSDRERGSANARIPTCHTSDSGGINLMLARLLFEAQGAKLAAGRHADGAWFAEVTFADRKAA